MKRIIVVVAVIVALFVLGACQQVPGQVPESDSSYGYSAGGSLPIDPKIYTISGYVYADIDSMVIQSQAASGRVYSSGYGVYHGAEYSGKTLVRLFVEKSDSQYALVESVVILKASDTKAAALMPKDRVTFKCRLQAEAIAAIFSGESFNQSEGLTYELDYCRLYSPVVDVP